MTPQQMVAFFLGQAKKCECNLEKPDIASSCELFALNLRGAAKAHLMAALICWRHFLEDPIPHLRRYAEIGKMAVGSLLARDTPNPVHARFPFYDVVYVATLLGDPMPSGVVSVLAGGSQQSHADPGFDYALAESLMSRRNILKRALADKTITRRQALFRESFLSYSALLDGEAAALRKAEELFLLRASDEYFSGGVQTDGGGPDNANTIDYRLAAVLQHVPETRSSIHALPQTN